MSYLYALAGLPWDWVCLGGALGGAVNAAVSNNLQPFPTWSARLTATGFPQMTRVGLFVNIAVGTVTPVGLLWILRDLGKFDALGAGIPLSLLGSSVFVGFIAARGVTSEVDKVLLRRAVRSAATAPAAHPEIAQAIDHAPPYAVYELASELNPRRPPSPLERLRVSSAFDRAHPQRS